MWCCLIIENQFLSRMCWVNKWMFWCQLKDPSAFTLSSPIWVYVTVGSFLLGTCTAAWASWRTVCWDWTTSRRATSTACGQAMTMLAGRTRASARAVLKWSFSSTDHGTSPPWRYSALSLSSSLGWALGLGTSRLPLWALSPKPEDIKCPTDSRNYRSQNLCRRYPRFAGVGRWSTGTLASPELGHSPFSIWLKYLRNKKQTPEAVFRQPLLAIKVDLGCKLLTV